MGKAIFSKDNIVLNASFENKWDAIRACGRILADNGYVSESYIDDMIEREKRACVYAGNNLAIPHGTDGSDKNIYTSGISFVQAPDGVMFDDEVAYILIGVAGKDGKHVDILGNIAIACSEMDTIQMLRTVQDKDVIYNTFADIKI